MMFLGSLTTLLLLAWGAATAKKWPFPWKAVHGKVMWAKYHVFEAFIVCSGYPVIGPPFRIIFHLYVCCYRAITKEIYVPNVQLTARTWACFGHWLTDRELFALAYCTEASIRSSKLAERDGANTEAEELAHEASTLESQYLIDLYPANQKGSCKPRSLLEIDRLAFNRKLIRFMREHKDHDGTLLPIVIQGQNERPQRERRPRFIEELLDHMFADKTMPAPPTYWHFQVLLEAICGYPIPSELLQSGDSSMPRAAIMGGSVAAALSAWRDHRILQIFNYRNHSSVLLRVLHARGIDPQMENEYIAAKNMLLSTLHDYFVDGGSDFSRCDVDFFLQASPLTIRKLAQLHSLPREVLDKISAYYAGGLGFCHDDVRLFAELFLRPLERRDEEGEFVYALSRNALTVMLAPYYPFEVDWRHKQWPRVTQLIGLDYKADLVGALMDFDQSIPACAYDGATVYVSPRCAYSAVRKINVMSPFCVQERRNKKRVVKYEERGFSPFALDPFCNHSPHCNNVQLFIAQEQYDQARECSGGRYKSTGFDEDEVIGTAEEYVATLELQDQAIEEGTGRWFCCCRRYVDECHGTSGCYSMALFEKSTYDATDFYAQLFEWSHEQRSEVDNVPNFLRMACTTCRYCYGLHLFLEGETPIESDEDIIQGWKYLKLQSSTGYPSFSFYGGLVFSSRSRENALSFLQAYEILRAQSLAERVRYRLKNTGSIKGYQPRILFYPESKPGGPLQVEVHFKQSSDDESEESHSDGSFEIRYDYAALKRSTREKLNSIFNRARATTFAAPKRPPIGLNPERFTESCKSCGRQLHNCEFGTQYCQRCAKHLQG